MNSLHGLSVLTVQLINQLLHRKYNFEHKQAHLSLYNLYDLPFSNQLNIGIKIIQTYNVQNTVFGNFSSFRFWNK